MSKKKTPPEYFLRLRTYPEQLFVSLWLVRRDGAASASLLFGEVHPLLAEEIALRLGLPVERDASSLAGIQVITPQDCLPLLKQGDLFAGLETSTESE